MKKAYCFLVAFFLGCVNLLAQPSQSFVLSMPEPASQLYHVEMLCSGFKEKELILSLPNWTPGYYQMLNYAKFIDNVKVVDEKGNPLPWKKQSSNTWSVSKAKSKLVKVTYTAKATIPFVAQSILDAEHGYIMPAGIFMHVKDYLSSAVTLKINNYPQWSTIATGLVAVLGKKDTYAAPDFDTFYDSPILLGNLEELPTFYVDNKPHRFIGYKVGTFDKQAFINDLQKIVQAGVDVIGEVPYPHYTFLAIGPVPGGIEHLNSTGFGFSSNDFDKRDRLLRMYTFLSHEYFHHYNAKRIRPIELGPFDYDNGSKTTMLWIAEGFTNYYDELLVKRAGVMSREEYLDNVRLRIQSFENKPGRLFQTASDASYQTWEDGPFGRTGDDAYKTISVYEKGSLLGLVLDLTIRHHTQNKKSLDDVMRFLYQEYYKKQNRGFTEAEFKQAAEEIAGIALPDFFDHVNTVKEIDYKKYLSYAGLQLTEKQVELPEPFIGITTRMQKDTLNVSRTDWQSPAWEAGIRSNDKIVSINGTKATREELSKVQKEFSPISIEIYRKEGLQKFVLQPTKKMERQMSLQVSTTITKLEKDILESWLNEN